MPFHWTIYQQCRWCTQPVIPILKVVLLWKRISLNYSYMKKCHSVKKNNNLKIIVYSELRTHPVPLLHRVQCLFLLQILPVMAMHIYIWFMISLRAFVLMQHFSSWWSEATHFIVTNTDHHYGHVDACWAGELGRCCPLHSAVQGENIYSTYWRVSCAYHSVDYSSVTSNNENVIF